MTPSMLSSPLQASECNPTQPRETEGCQALEISLPSWQGIARSQQACGIPLTSVTRARRCTPHHFHLQALQLLAKREGRHYTFIPLPVLNHWVVTHPACSHRVSCSQSWVGDKGKKVECVFMKHFFLTKLSSKWQEEE